MSAETPFKVVEISRSIDGFTASYAVLNGRGETAALIDAAPEFDAVIDDGEAATGETHYVVTWSRSLSTYPGQFRSTNLATLAAAIHDWEELATRPPLNALLESQSRAQERLQLAAGEAARRSGEVRALIEDFLAGKDLHSHPAVRSLIAASAPTTSVRRLVK